VSCFVAHLSIRPTREWQDEIERALFSMDALIALLTKDFQKSNWTDQEISIALGRKVPVIPLKIDKKPLWFYWKDPSHTLFVGRFSNKNNQTLNEI